MQSVKTILKNFKETKERIGLTRFDRIEKYLKKVESHKLNSKKDIASVKEIRNLINYRLIKVKRLYYLNMFLYFGVYFSVFSIVFPNLFVVSEVANLISSIVGVLGSTIFIVGIYISNRVQELYYQDLNLLTAHFISIYSQSEKKSKISAGVSNIYSDFIDFFKNK